MDPVLRKIEAVGAAYLETERLVALLARHARPCDHARLADRAVQRLDVDRPAQWVDRASLYAPWPALGEVGPPVGHSSRDRGPSLFLCPYPHTAGVIESFWSVFLSNHGVAETSGLN